MRILTLVRAAGKATVVYETGGVISQGKLPAALSDAEIAARLATAVPAAAKKPVKRGKAVVK